MGIQLYCLFNVLKISQLKARVKWDHEDTSLKILDIILEGKKTAMNHLVNIP